LCVTHEFVSGPIYNVLVLNFSDRPFHSCEFLKLEAFIILIDNATQRTPIWYPVLLAAFYTPCVPILGHMIGILCANTKCYRRDGKVINVIAPYRMPTEQVVGTTDTMGIRCAYKCKRKCFWCLCLELLASWISNVVSRPFLTVH
jgi:hypothetical protein